MPSDESVGGTVLPRIVANNMSFEKALRIFRKKVENANLKDDLRKKEFYEKPNQKRRRKANEQKRRNQRARAKEMDMYNNYRSKFGRKA
jgi:small subunit ribosomal protein S21